MKIVIDDITIKLGRFVHDTMVFVDGNPIGCIKRVDVAIASMDARTKREICFGDAMRVQGQNHGLALYERFARAGFDVFIEMPGVLGVGHTEKLLLNGRVD